MFLDSVFQFLLYFPSKEVLKGNLTGINVIPFFNSYLKSLSFNSVCKKKKCLPTDPLKPLSRVTANKLFFKDGLMHILVEGKQTLIVFTTAYLIKPYVKFQNRIEASIRSLPKNKKLELVFIKHYAPNSMPLTVNSHHVLFVKRLPKFSKGHNSRKIR